MILRLLAISALALGLATPALAGYNVSTFEDVGLTTPDSYFNAVNGNHYLTDPTASSSGQFVSGGSSLANSYTYYSQYGVGSWSGWSISNQTNTAYINQGSTPDYGFQYTSATGSGAVDSSTGKASATYAVSNTEGNGKPAVSIVNLAAGTSASSVQVTNTAYDVDAILHGDSFASAFTAGNYFNLTIYGYTGLNGTGTLVASPITFSLAAYPNPNQGPGQPTNFVLTTWQTLDLSTLAGAQSLVFGTDTNDTNAYGEALPFEFAMDNLTTFSPSVVPEPSSFLLCLTGIGIVSLIHRRARPRKGPL